MAKLQFHFIKVAPHAYFEIICFSIAQISNILTSNYFLVVYLSMYYSLVEQTKKSCLNRKDGYLRQLPDFRVKLREANFRTESIEEEWE